MRAPWPNGFPPVMIHGPWQGDGFAGLADDTEYFPAKKKRDINAAARVCARFIREDVCEQIFDTCVDNSERPPLVIAPAMNILESQNVLAIGYAQRLACEMGWEVAKHVFQGVSVKRDFVTDNWFRIAHQPEFYGDVEHGRRYVIADDVCTMGGTIASLRGFIESKGGNVICATTLAGRAGGIMEIAISSQTLYGLQTRDDGRFAEVVMQELGYGLECLTEPEGRFLLRCASPERFREGVHGARYA